MIVVLAPYPKSHQASDGFYQRVLAIDEFFKTKKRVYIAFDHGRLPLKSYPLKGNSLLEAWEFSPSHDFMKREVLERLASAELIYVHSIYCLHYFRALTQLPHLAQKTILDFHGAVPEEQILLGRNEDYAREYRETERLAIENLSFGICVSEAMRNHLLKKYQQVSMELIVLPIFSQPVGNEIESEQFPSSPSFVYSGGLQKWQGLDEMMSFMEQLSEPSWFTFLTPEPRKLKRRLFYRGKKIAHHVIVKSVEPSSVGTELRRNQFGLIFREDTVVNRVSCPTKLMEYLSAGLIPVLTNEKLGDFEKFGFLGLRAEEIVKVGLPDSRTLDDIRKTNAHSLAEFCKFLQFSQGLFETILSKLSAKKREQASLPFGYSDLESVWELAKRLQIQHPESMKVFPRFKRSLLGAILGSYARIQGSLANLRRDR